MDIRDAEISILNKLWRHDKFGGEYEPFEKISSGIPSEHQDRAKDAVENLVSSGLVIRHKNKELYSINTENKREVKK
ncbi:MAG: hypothetical protein ABEJ03_02625 [Candidatus Nanohaloarchaea archaeon]